MKKIVLSAALATVVSAAFAISFFPTPTEPVKKSLSIPASSIASPAMRPGRLTNVKMPLGSVPKAEWQPKEALQQKLEGEGWKVKKLKIDDGCYEVYGTDAQGKRMEVYFDPKTFATVKSKSES